MGKDMNNSVLATLDKKYTVEELNTNVPLIQVGTSLSSKGVMAVFQHISGLNYGGYYVGITGRVREREKEHCANFLVVIDSSSVDDANKLEELAKSYGFDTGDATGNGHDEDTTKVYIYKKILGVTKE